MGLSKTIKYHLESFLISIKLKKNFNDLNNDIPTLRDAVISNKQNSREKKINTQEEREIKRLIEIINEFLGINNGWNDYNQYVANIYKQQGYLVWEYSRDNKEDSEVNLVLKRGYDIVLVQCKSDNSNINIDNIQKFQVTSSNFLKKYHIFKNYSVKLRYTMSGLFLEESAYEYIKDNWDKIDYEIIKINYISTKQ